MKLFVGSRAELRSALRRFVLDSEGPPLLPLAAL
jgi:hypothetical protein